MNPSSITGETKRNKTNRTEPNNTRIKTKPKSVAQRNRNARCGTRTAPCVYPRHTNRGVSSMPRVVEQRASVALLVSQQHERTNERSKQKKELVGLFRRGRCTLTVRLHREDENAALEFFPKALRRVARLWNGPSCPVVASRYAIVSIAKNTTTRPCRADCKRKWHSWNDTKWVAG